MTKEIWNKYKDHKTKNGWTLARSINTGVINPSSFLGCHAGDMESYSDFLPLFKGAIEKYHVGYDMETMKHVTDMDVKKIGTALAEHAQKKIISTRIRCARNLSFFPLNTCGTKKTREDIAELLEGIFKTFKGDLAGKFYRHTTMTEDEIKELVDKHFLFRGKDKMQAASGYHADWPHGRGIFVSKDEKFLMWLKEVTKREEVYMSSPSLGMITCCPTNLGTGMRGSVHIMIPKLIKKIGFEGIDKIARSMHCQARGSTGEHSEVIDRVDISNWRRLGTPEFSLVEDMIKCVNVISQMEDEIEG